MTCDYLFTEVISKVNLPNLDKQLTDLPEIEIAQPEMEIDLLELETALPEIKTALSQTETA